MPDTRQPGQRGSQPSDLDALVEALAWLMDDAELREQIGKSGRVVEQYDLCRSVERLAGIFAGRIEAR